MLISVGSGEVEHGLHPAFADHQVHEGDAGQGSPGSRTPGENTRTIHTTVGQQVQKRNSYDIPLFHSYLLLTVIFFLRSISMFSMLYTKLKSRFWNSTNFDISIKNIMYKHIL